MTLAQDAVLGKVFELHTKSPVGGLLESYPQPSAEHVGVKLFRIENSLIRRAIQDHISINFFSCPCGTLQ